jgi:hypothetical protein
MILRRIVQLVVTAASVLIFSVLAGAGHSADAARVRQCEEPIDGHFVGGKWVCDIACTKCGKGDPPYPCCGCCTW